MENNQLEDKGRQWRRKKHTVIENLQPDVLTEYRR